MIKKDANGNNIHLNFTPEIELKVSNGTNPIGVTGVYNDYVSMFDKSVVDFKTTTESKNATRYNKNKLRWHNVPMFFLKPIVEVGDYASRSGKYETFNFLKGFPINEIMDSLKRHLDSFESPFESDLDSESAQNHLAHVAWNALAIIHTLKVRPDLDNRYKLADEEGQRLNDLEEREKIIAEEKINLLKK